MSAIEQIERELRILNQAIATLSQNFHSAYHQYLAALGQAVRQQLILASYHICTRGYPQQFLALSLHQQQQLQQALRQLAKQAEATVIEQLQPIKPGEYRASPSSQATARALATQLAEITADLEQQDIDQFVDKLEQADLTVQDLDVDSEAYSETEETKKQREIENQGLFTVIFENEILEELVALEPAIPTDEPKSVTPKDLLYWQENLEDKVIHELQEISHTANRSLQQAGILPQRLPEPILEVAAKADLPPESTTTPPNLLSLLIEAAPDENQESVMTPIMAIRLRLSEIEFSDPLAMTWRSKIRNLSAQLGQLKRDYQKKLKEKAIAQAESAWRSSWYED